MKTIKKAKETAEEELAQLKFAQVSKWNILKHVKLDGVGPVDNRPSTDKLHHFVRIKEEEKKRRKKDMQHVTRDT
jgi:hypothetical protein